MRYPKFEEKLRENISSSNFQGQSPNFGIVLDYSAETNTATVMSARPGSAKPGEIYKDVPCPQNIGVQMVAPEPGRPCQLSFPGGTQVAPMIVGFFNPRHVENDYMSNTLAKNDIPRFMMEL